MSLFQDCQLLVASCLFGCLLVLGLWSSLWDPPNGSQVRGFIFQDCHCCLIIRCFFLFLSLSLVVWFSCGSQVGCEARPCQRRAAACVLHFHSSDATHSVSAEKASWSEHHKVVDLLPPLLTQSSSLHPSQTPTPTSEEASKESLDPPPALTAPIDRRSALRARRATACDCRGVTWSRCGRPAGK